MSTDRITEYPGRPVSIHTQQYTFIPTPTLLILSLSLSTLVTSLHPVQHRCSYFDSVREFQVAVLDKTGINPSNQEFYFLGNLVPLDTFGGC